MFDEGHDWYVELKVKNNGPMSQSEATQIAEQIKDKLNVLLESLEKV